jgi:hypothetical protein
MTRTVALALLVVAAIVTGPAAPPLAAQTPSTGAAGGAAAPDAGGSGSEAAYPYDLEHIREQLSRPSTGIDWELPEGTPVFRVDIQNRMPGIEAILGDVKALQRGPWVSSPYHQEFLDLVTPPEARASFTNSELLQVLATGLAGGLALQGLTNAIKSYVRGNRTREACDAVRTTLTELNRDRADAGLAPVYVPEC